MAPLIATEAEDAILRLAYQPTIEWAERASVAPTAVDPMAEERELNRRASRRVLDILYDVDREFIHIELGLV